MSPLAFYRDLLAKGLREGVAYEMAAKLEAHREAEVKTRENELLDRIAASVKTDARKARNSRHYEKKKASKASESVSIKMDQTVSDVNKTVKTPSDAQPSCARVEDISPKLVTTGYQTTPDSAGEPDLDWPETDKPSRAYLDKLEAVLRRACGAALASEAVAPRVRVLAPILALGKPGKGPRCELQADVLPIIQARAARCAPGSVKSWDFFREAILEARDRRLAGAPATADVVALRSTGPPGGNIADREAAKRAEAHRRVLES